MSARLPHALRSRRRRRRRHLDQVRGLLTAAQWNWDMYNDSPGHVAASDLARKPVAVITSAALAATPVDLAAAHEARVRREALREGARLVDLERSCREEHGAGPEQIGALLVAVSILRSEAKRIEGGGR